MTRLFFKSSATELRLLPKPRLALMLLAGAGCLLSAAPVYAAGGPTKPALTITNDPLPPELQSRVYNTPSRAPVISSAQISGTSYFGDNSETVVGRKVNELRNELFSIQGKVGDLSERLAASQTSGRAQAAEYYASVATISTQLQAGTTPGNPRLVSRLNIARDNLEKLSGNIASLNNLAVESSNVASMASYLLESTRAAYGLSGAVEEDHVRLAQMEDSINSTIVVVDRLLNNVNDDITRTVAYLSTERENLRTLSLAITTGDLFGKSLANRPFARAQQAAFTPQPSSARYNHAPAPMAEPVPMAAPAPLAPPPQQRNSEAAYIPPAPVPPQHANLAVAGGPRPLVKIRFDRPDVNYEQPVYLAVNEAMSRYPNARFELVAIHPEQGNVAQVAIESTKARRNAERVLRSLTQMGLDTNRVDLSYAPSRDATTNEVHLYVQ